MLPHVLINLRENALLFPSRFKGREKREQQTVFDESGKGYSSAEIIYLTNLGTKLLEQELSMEEILELKQCLLHQEYDRAFAIVEDLEAMGRQDKINNLESFLVILLIHLIKIQVEKRVTRSWMLSISNSLLAIQKRNKLGKKSHYIKQGE